MPIGSARAWDARRRRQLSRCRHTLPRFAPLAHLQSLLHYLAPFCRMKVLPLVCRRFHQLLSQPGPCWRALVLPYHRIAEQEAEKERLRCFLAFARCRAAGLHDLRISMAFDLRMRDVNNNGTSGPGCHTWRSHLAGWRQLMPLPSPCQPCRVAGGWPFGFADDGRS